MTEDDYDRWAAIFQANRLHERFGITFAAFIDRPHAYLAAYIFLAPRPEPDGYYDLLPEQRAVQRAIDEQCDTEVALLQVLTESVLASLEPDLRGLRFRNGALVEPLHHHAYPRRHRRRLLRSA